MNEYLQRLTQIHFTKIETYEERQTRRTLTVDQSKSKQSLG